MEILSNFGFIWRSCFYVCYFFWVLDRCKEILLNSVCVFYLWLVLFFVLGLSVSMKFGMYEEVVMWCDKGLVVFFYIIDKVIKM